MMWCVRGLCVWGAAATDLVSARVIMQQGGGIPTLGSRKRMPLSSMRCSTRASSDYCSLLQWGRCLVVATVLCSVRFGVVVGHCPNLCAGNGNCTAGNTCACNVGFFGGDCSLRTYCVKAGLRAVTFACQCRLNCRPVVHWRRGVRLAEHFCVVFFWLPSEHCPTAMPLFAKGSAGTTVHTDTAVECSGTGSCDYTTGTCRCNDGFGGDSCQRGMFPSCSLF